MVSSPSFSPVNEYDTGPAAVSRLYHLDLYGYRMRATWHQWVRRPGGIRQRRRAGWPERAATVLPERFLLIEIETVGSNYPRLRFVPTPDADEWMDRFERLRSDFAT